jgi:hypothetical protein
MVDFPVKLTPGLPELYKDPALPEKDNIDLFQQRAGLAIWNIALYLYLHGCIRNNNFKFPSALFEFPYLREFSWAMRKNYYRYIDLPIDTFRKHLRSWVTGEPIDEPPF